VCVQEANLAKSCTAQIKGSIFLKINQNYFAQICPEYGFRVKQDDTDMKRRYCKECLSPNSFGAH